MFVVEGLKGRVVFVTRNRVDGNEISVFGVEGIVHIYLQTCINL
jgi:hypothetical protein